MRVFNARRSWRKPPRNALNTPQKGHVRGSPASPARLRPPGRGPPISRPHPRLRPPGEVPPARGMGPNRPGGSLAGENVRINRLRETGWTPKRRVGGRWHREAVSDPARGLPAASAAPESRKKPLKNPLKRPQNGWQLAMVDPPAGSPGAPNPAWSLCFTTGSGGTLGTTLVGGAGSGSASQRGPAHVPSRAAKRRPDRNSSRYSKFRVWTVLGTTRGVMARSRPTIARASPSRPMWA